MRNHRRLTAICSIARDAENQVLNGAWWQSKRLAKARHLIRRISPLAQAEIIAWKQERGL